MIDCTRPLPEAIFVYGQSEMAACKFRPWVTPEYQDHFLSPPVQFARWAHMHHFLSVDRTGSKRGKIIHIWGSIRVRNLKLYHNILCS